MNNASAGITLAAVVAGWPLYELVAGGDLDLTTAILRGGVVALGCAIGVRWVVRIAKGYERQIRVDKSRKLNALFSDMESAMATGALRDEDGESGGSSAEGAGSSPAAEPSEETAEATRE